MKVLRLNRLKLQKKKEYQTGSFLCFSLHIGTKYKALYTLQFSKKTILVELFKVKLIKEEKDFTLHFRFL